MNDEQAGVSRRRTLKLVGGIAGATLGATGVAAGASKSTRTNIGYSSILGRKAALSVAEEVVYDFAFDALTIELPLSDLLQLRGTPGIRYVEADKRVEALAQTLPFGVDRVDADVAHANGETGAGADIAIIDTGIENGHPDLEANLGEGRAFLNGIESGQWNDDHGHGTHCAGTANAVDNSTGVVGVSTQATLHAVKVLTATGAGSTSDVAAGIEYVGEKGWDVGSLSLGGERSGVLRDACEYAHGQGVFLVAAAGNSGPCTDCVAYPGANQYCTAVSATDANDALADFSSQGPEVDIAAPGVDIYSSSVPSTYKTLSGTSMAAPHVAGAAGQLMADGSTNDEALDRLKRSAEDVGLSSQESGAGLLDVESALLGTTDGDDGGGDGGDRGGGSGGGLLGGGVLDGLL